MDIVVDIQGMRGKDSEFIPKEIAVVTLNNSYWAHWITSPPCHFGELPENSRKQNNFVSKYYHGLEWFEGDASLKQVYANLREISRRSRNIYTRGHEKMSFLRDVTSRDIINLEDYADAPSYAFMPKSERKCLKHALLNGTNAEHCAMTQASQIKNWLCKYNLLKEKKRKEEEKNSSDGHDTVDVSVE